MYQKQKRLVMSSENPVRIYLIENKIVSHFLAAKGIGKKGSSVEFVGKAR